MYYYIGKTKNGAHEIFSQELRARNSDLRGEKYTEVIGPYRSEENAKFTVQCLSNPARFLYVGTTKDGVSEIFKSDKSVSPDTLTGSEYKTVIGPFRTRSNAEYAIKVLQVTGEKK